MSDRNWSPEVARALGYSEMMAPTEEKPAAVGAQPSIHVRPIRPSGQTA